MSNSFRYLGTERSNREKLGYELSSLNSIFWIFALSIKKPKLYHLSFRQVTYIFIFKLIWNDAQMSFQVESIWKLHITSISFMLNIPSKDIKELRLKLHGVFLGIPSQVIERSMINTEGFWTKFCLLLVCFLFRQKNTGHLARH